MIKRWLVREWRQAWRMYSTWWIVLMSILAATNGFIDEIRAMLGLNLWQTILLTALTILSGLALRLIPQRKVRRNGDEQQD